MPRINLAGVGGFEPLEEGQYEATYVGGKYTAKSKSSGQPSVSVTFQLSEDGLENRKLFKNYSLQPQSLWAFKQLLVALGMDEESLEEGDFDVEEVLKELVGARVILDVTVGEYQGQKNNQVRRVLTTESAF